MKVDIRRISKIVSLPLAISFILPFADSVLGGREPYAHAGTCLGFLVYVAFSYSHLLSAIRNTDSHRDYSINKMDFTSMSAHGNLAGYRNFFLYWPANLCFCLVRWSFIQVEKDLVFSRAVHA